MVPQAAGSGLKLRALVVIFAVPPVSSPGPSSASLRTTTIVVIPARYHSTRLPGKALADIGGRPMIEHVYRRASDATRIDAMLLYDTILPSIGSSKFADQFFIRKGIGWALRERSYAAPEEVQAFCREYARQLAPLSVREALKVIHKRSAR